ncbi:MAG: hypothetical protein NC079_09610 [Clostridium sp.]|nr:hypothetical protein [Acetatifactor muris]MCM1527608.1 hypothetical protein [Bacteroides sp.]MCM1563849.1 hypothetical protein [Clostridium sp.]
MSEETIMMWVRVLPPVAAGIMFAGIPVLAGSRGSRRLLRACEELGGYLALRSRDSDRYKRTAEWLCKKGAVFHSGNWLQPLTFLAMNLSMASVGAVIGLCLSPWLAVPLAVGFYFIPGLLVRYLDHRDNERLLPELKLIYHGLEIQIRAGVYMTDALAECYAGIQNTRLRQALLDLAGAIAVKADVYDALNRFQTSFDNRYIDALCITLLQALESGKAVELLGDIAEQVKDMEVSVMNRRKGALDRSVTFYQLGILAAVLGLVLYACVTRMFAAALYF